MTTYYVGIGGDDGANGTSWATRKLTLNGAEDIPVAANDTVYVGPGTYRESLTVDVSGSAGQPITYIGDYLGTNTDGIGGVVRVTNSADDMTPGANSVFTGTSKNYRTFQGFALDGSTNNTIGIATSANVIIDSCHITAHAAQAQIGISGAGTANHAVKNCVFICNPIGVFFTHSSVVNNSNCLVQNCIFIGYNNPGVRTARIGGITVKNCLFIGGLGGVTVTTALTAGQTVVVNNNIFMNLSVGVAGAEIVEDYNDFSNCVTPRGAGVGTGANSNVYMSLLDTRWFFQAVFAGANPSAKQLISPFDLASYSPLINVAGTSPSATDLRGTGTLGTQREWGALEYDSSLDISAKRGANIGGGLIGE